MTLTLRKEHGQYTGMSLDSGSNVEGMEFKTIMESSQPLRLHIVDGEGKVLKQFKLEEEK